MTTFNSIKNHFASRPVLHSTFVQPAQGGVVLIIVLILLVVISMLAVTSMSNTGSTERVMANVRTTELATQAAEIALRYCEAIANVNANPSSTTAKKSITTDYWKSLDRWDKTRGVDDIRVLSLNAVNTTAGIDTYKRPPECMLERISAAPDIYLVTARGFGPEVAAYKSDDVNPPQGTEVWLQSQVEFKINTGVSS